MAINMEHWRLRQQEPAKAKPRMAFRDGVWTCSLGEAIGSGATMRDAWDNLHLRHRNSPVQIVGACLPPWHATLGSHHILTNRNTRQEVHATLMSRRLDNCEFRAVWMVALPGKRETATGAETLGNLGWYCDRPAPAPRAYRLAAI